MTETAVWKLIIKLSIPTMISMMITTIYNTADTYFVSKISVSASAATGIVFSLMALLQAFGFMLGHGAGSGSIRCRGSGFCLSGGGSGSGAFLSAAGAEGKYHRQSEYHTKNLFHDQYSSKNVLILNVF